MSQQSNTPKYFTIDDIFGLPDGAIIYAFRGTIKKIFDRKERPPKPPNNKPWSLENVIVKDASGNEIKMCLKDRPALPNNFREGTAFVLLAKQSEKQGYTGVKAMDDTYKEETNRVIWVTASATIVEAKQFDQGGAGNSAATKTGADTQTRQNSQPANGEGAKSRRSDSPEQSRQASNGNSRQNPEYDQEKAVAHARACAGKCANAYMLAYVAAKSVDSRLKAEHGFNMDLDQFQACCSSLYISLTRDHKIDGKLPPGPVDFRKSAKPKKEPPKEEPRREQSRKNPDDDRPQDVPTEFPNPEDDDVPF